MLPSNWGMLRRMDVTDWVQSMTGYFGFFVFQGILSDLDSHENGDGCLGLSALAELV